MLDPPICRLSGAVTAGGVTNDGRDVGADKYTGFRLTTLWQPSDELAITLGYTQQDIEQEGFPEVNINLAGDYQQARLGVGSDGSQNEFLGNDIGITNLLVEYDLGWGDLHSSSSWIDYDSTNTADFSELLAVFGLSAPLYVHGIQNTEVFTEELRLTSRFDGNIQFLIGFYYEDIDTDKSAPISWSGIPNSNVFETQQLNTNSTEQKALFGEVSFQVTDTLLATVGGRYFEYDQSTLFTGSGDVFYGPVPVVSSTQNSDSSQNYKVNLTYTPNEDLMFYGQWSEGFRLGAAKLPLISTCDTNQDGLIDGLELPSKEVDPDELESFELGFKGSFADNRITFNAALYYIDWQGIPVTIAAPCGVAFPFNAGKSKSEGIELELKTHLTDNLRVDLSAAYGEATLTEDIPNVISFGAKGDNLPGSSDYNISIGAEYSFNLAGVDSFVRGDYSYVGEYFNSFDEDKLDPNEQASGGYGQLNLKAGFNFDQLSVDIFVNNLTNANEYTWVESFLGDFGFNRAYRLRPRTIGLNLGYTF